MKTIKVKEFEVPVSVMGEVAGIIADNELENTITGVDEESEIIVLEARYKKGVEEEQDAIHQIQDAIHNYEEEDDEDDDES